MKRFVIFLLPVVLFGCSGSGNNNVCEAGRQLECACPNDVTGYQTCLADGSGWGDCLCECEKDCTGRECGDDPICGESCGTCTDNSTCSNTGGCECDYVECSEACCSNGEKCLGGQCTDCCVDAEAGKWFVDITGEVTDITTGTGAANIGVAAISMWDALVSPTPTLYSPTTTGADGTFYLDCFDVTSVALGAFVITDDSNWDGIAGALYPTGTSVVGWSMNAEKVCTEDAVAFAVPTAMVGMIGQLPDVDPDNNGFVMGMVVDENSDKVAGAVIKIQDASSNWVDPVSVYYPNVPFSDLTTGTETSAIGLFILPASNFSEGIRPINAEKTGMTFSEQQAAPRGGFVFFMIISPTD